ncbi:MAG: chromosome segregation ATPase [Rhizonema sp. NSF051]|nr:chromosome segregation ATPase [Rhizonema sp. NSF051]
MTERDIPDSWSIAKEPDKIAELSRRQQFSDRLSDVPATGSTLKSVQRSKENNSEVALDSQSPVIKPRNSGKLPGWTKSWVLWTLLLALVPGAIAFSSMAMLLKLPSAPNCPEIFWPLASASVRLNCAQLAASKETVKDLLQAIALVKEVPEDHPLRGQVDHFLKEWSQDILQLADESFQLGKLDEAMATARKIPTDVDAAKLVDEKITKWESIWSKADGIYNDSVAQIRDEKWHQAFMLASRLLRVNNKYWANSKYDELNRLIVVTREDSEKLAKAESTSKDGTVEDLLKAIKLAESIGQQSFMYQKAQDAIPDYGRKMLHIAQNKLDKQDANAAISIAQKIPVNAKLQIETEDFIALAEAQRNAWIGTVASLQTAISQAQQIDTTRPAYDKAQKLVVRWQLEIEDLAHLEKAQELANGGTINDLTAAVAEAQIIPGDHPRAKEARGNIAGWIAQVQTIEDRPYLDHAEQLAMLEDINSLQAAVAEASQIHRGRALYPEAQSKIAAWIGSIQRIQDQPILDQAQELARNGNLPAAIATAQRISSGRALSKTARASAEGWLEQISARDNWKKAQETAIAGTPEALAEAIRLANLVPDNSSLRSDVNVTVDQWSQQLLDIARSQSQSDIVRGIETAKLVPRGSAAYTEAREQIKTWRQFLHPQPTEQPQPTTTEQPLIEQQ